MLRRTAQGRRIKPVAKPSSGLAHAQAQHTVPQAQAAKKQPQEMIRQPMRINLNP
jgi:hypothetical protein